MGCDFCTYFDRNYFSRAMALYDSIARNCSSFTFWALCLDAEAKRLLDMRALPHVQTVGLDELEASDPELLRCRGNRNLVEYYFTLTSAWTSHLLQSQPAIDLLVYADADMFFFGDLQPLFTEFGSASIGITEHRFTPRLRKLARFGRFNVGVILFRNDTEGRACAAAWRTECINWCYDRLEEERFADQKYLDKWPQRYENLQVIRHKGVNLASWNIENYDLSLRNGHLYVDEESLICFHFHGFKQLSQWVYWCNFSQELQRASRKVKQWIMRPYIRPLEKGSAV